MDEIVNGEKKAEVRMRSAEILKSQHPCRTVPDGLPGLAHFRFPALVVLFP